MGLDNFDIIFDKPVETFFPGETVSGNLVVALNSEKRMEKIKVIFQGKSEVRFKKRRTTRRGGRTRTNKVTYKSHEIYFSMDKYVFDGPSLDSGVHNFPFSFVLPQNLPSSYEARMGHVRYEAKGEIVRSWKFNHHCRKIFTVNGILDLNQNPQCREPDSRKDLKTLGCCCFQSGPISATISSKRTGYVPGEIIDFQAEVDNKSDKVLGGSKVQLLEHITYTGSRGFSNKTNKETRIVAQSDRGGIDAGDSEVWDGKNMRIPAVPPTNLGGQCGIIQISYSLKLLVETPGMSFDLEVKLPITIGTIPLQESMSTILPPTGQGPLARTVASSGYTHPSFSNTGYVHPGIGAPSAPNGVQPPANPWAIPPPVEQFNPYPNMPAPSYGESTWGSYNVGDKNSSDDEDYNEHLKGDKNFLPKYVMYNTHASG